MPSVIFAKSLLNEAGITPETNFDYAVVTRLLRAIETRISPLEGQRERVDQAIEDVRNLGLARINEVLLPAIQSVLTIQERGFLIARSTTPATLGEGNVLTLYVDDADERALFTPSPFVALTRQADYANYGIARSVSYDRENGQFICEVMVFEGVAGPHDDWVIAGMAGPTLATIAYATAAGTASTAAVDARTDVLSALQQAVAAANRAEAVTADNASAAANAHVWAFASATADADPGNGQFRLNHATAASVTQIFVDNLFSGGVDAVAVINRYGDSTTTNDRGTLTLRQIDDPSKWVTYRVTSSITDGTGYRKFSASHLAGPGGFVAGKQVSFVFQRSGNRGLDGEGSGDVVGPAVADGGNFAVFTDGSGKVLGDSGVNPTGLAVALAGKAAAEHTHGTSGLDDGAVTYAKIAAAAIAAEAEAQAGTANDKLLNVLRGKQQLDANAEPLGRLRGVAAKTANHTLEASDMGKVIEMANAAARTITVPTHATLALPVDSYVNVCRAGAGGVEIVAAEGVTIRAARGTKLAQQWSEATLRKRGNNEWVLSGDLEP